MHGMSIATTKQLENLQTLADVNAGNDMQHLTVLTIVKTMLEIIKIKSVNIMDEGTQEQFPMIANEIILLAEHTQ